MGIGFGIGFGWGSYWGSYPYYGYYAPPYYPYYYPYAYPYPYPYPNYAPAGDPPSNPVPPSQGSNYTPDNPPAQQYRAPTQPSSSPAYPSAAATNGVTIREASYTSSVPRYPAQPVTNNYRPASSPARQLPPLRPEVQNVIRALRAMPPNARESQLGRYGNLTPKELQIVRYAADLPPA